MPSFKLVLTAEADGALQALEGDDPKKAKKVKKTLGLLEQNPRHPSLQTHKFQSLRGPSGEEVFTAYVENNTPSAWRVFFCYRARPRTQALKAKFAAEPAEICVIAITPHP